MTAPPAPPADPPLAPVSPGTTRRPRGSRRELTPRQHRAAAALLTPRSYTDAAKAARVNRRTLYAWRRDPRFASLVRSLQNGVLRGTTRRAAEARTETLAAAVRASRAVADLAETPGRGVWATIGGARVLLEEAGLLRPDAEIAALRKEVGRLRREVARLRADVGARGPRP